ncbi:hypothetical protein FACS1894120_2560 [Clostridia bacterium]|nr:hypothetical protein FACS1894120_2560 [Clostridia bacterium]
MAKHIKYRDLSLEAQTEVKSRRNLQKNPGRKPKRKRKSPQWELFFYRCQPILYGALFGASTAVYGLSGSTTMAFMGAYEKYFGVLQLKPHAADSENKSESESPPERAKPLRPALFCIFAAVGFCILGVLLAQVFDAYGMWTRMLYIGLILGGIPTILQSTTLIDDFRNSHWFLIFAGIAACILILLTKGSSGSYTIDQERLEGNRVQITLTNTGRDPFADWAIRIKSGNASEINGARLSRKDSPVSAIATLATGRSEKPNALAPTTTGVLGKGQSVHITYKMKNNRFLELEPIVTYRFTATFAVTVFASMFVGGFCMSLPGLPLSMLLAAFGTLGTLNAAISSRSFGIIAVSAVFGFAGFMAGVRAIGRWIRSGSSTPYALIVGLLLGNIVLVFPEDFGLGIDALIGLLMIAVGGAIALAIGTELRLDAEAKEALSE